MRWWAGKHLGGVAFVPPHGKPRLSYCVMYCELTALVAVRLDCASFCRLCEYVRAPRTQSVDDEQSECGPWPMRQSFNVSPAGDEQSVREIGQEPRLDRVEYGDRVY